MAVARDPQKLPQQQNQEAPGPWNHLPTTSTPAPITVPVENDAAAIASPTIKRTG